MLRLRIRNSIVITHYNLTTHLCLHVTQAQNTVAAQFAARCGQCGSEYKQWCVGIQSSLQIQK